MALHRVRASSSRVKHRLRTSKAIRNETFSANRIESCKLAAAAEAHHNASSPPELSQNGIDGDSDWEMADDILAGNLEISISHAGGELDALLEEWEQETQCRR
jgi:hypothetical protein